MAFFGIGTWGRDNLLKKFGKGSKDFSGKTLTAIDLSDVTLGGCNFTGCNLSGANFAGATLRGCKFREAKLRGAIFSGAKISHCDFRDAQLEELITEGAEFSTCYGLAGLPLAVMGESFFECSFQERLGYVLAFLEEFPGELEEAPRKEVVAIQKFLSHEGRPAVLGIPCGGTPVRVTVPLTANKLGNFKLWYAESFSAPVMHSTCGGPVFPVAEVGEEFGPNVWASELPEELEKIKERLRSLGPAREELFRSLNHEHIHDVDVSEHRVHYKLGPFFHPDIREAIALAISTGAMLAEQLER